VHDADGLWSVFAGIIRLLDRQLRVLLAPGLDLSELDVIAEADVDQVPVGGER